VTNECRIFNLYGPAETTIDCTLFNVNQNHNLEFISIGKPMQNYRCQVLDEYLQNVMINQQGELFVGGVGVFAGYLGRQDLTEKSLLNINDEIFYRTGDIVKMDCQGLIYYQGRKDHQIKINGQRIELGEIERCLLKTHISACIVVKWKENNLIGYVESSDISEKELREHCSSHLPSYMIPSMFIILERFPLNANGKVDRRCLPSPDLSSTKLLSSAECDVPLNDLEKSVHEIWCEVIKCAEKDLSTTIGFFRIGGDSLLFVEVYYRYQSLFDFDSNILSISLFIQQPTIVQHAKILSKMIISDIKWNKLYINQGNLTGEPKLFRQIFVYFKFPLKCF
jgi:hypothetical protein